LKALIIFILFISVTIHKQNNMQTQTQTQPDILQQFSDMLKNHSIVVADRANLVKLLENFVALCTQMPKTKLKAAVKAATKPAAKKQPVRETLVGPADAGDCPMMSDLEAPARGRGRPRKADATAVVVTDNDAEKKKRGRPKKDKTVTISSNDDEDALIAKMIADVKKNAKQSAAVAVAEEDDDITESELDEFNGELIRVEEETTPVVANSVSPVHQVEPIHSDVPIEVEAEVEAVVVNKTKAKSKQVKEPKVKEIKVKEIKVKEIKVKEPKVKEPKVKETKVKEPKANEPKAKQTKKVAKTTADDVVAAVVPVPVPDTVAPAAVIQGSVSSATPLRENKASSDGNFYLMPNYPRQSFTYNGKTYLRTETDNVYDTMTLEMIGVWDHLNHEIITAFDDEEVEELWLSDEE